MLEPGIVILSNFFYLLFIVESPFKMSSIGNWVDAATADSEQALAGKVRKEKEEFNS